MLWDLIYRALSNSLNKICQKDGLQHEIITFLTLGLLIDSYNDKKGDTLLKNSVKKMFERGHRKSLEALIEESYFFNYFESEELYSLLFNSNSPYTKKILRFFKDYPQFEILFNKILEKYDYLDKKRKAITGISGAEAKDFIIGIISDIIEPGYQSIILQFREIILLQKEEENDG